ncbi:hypothetical protein ADEAN_000653500 [Angomonas deanei]|uniref:Uncharacterized protein n=1 Tax=Angomonas deanei TaxID=59799 RepID=A0A7G2CLB7_9TRYP|nr:hypothetical protein ADEAN_000653500 [Angomonas deanei]
MSKRKTVASDSVAATKWQQDPKQLVVLQSNDGQLYAIDKNCASVSRLCVDYWSAYEAVANGSGQDRASNADYVTYIDFYGDDQALVDVPLSYLNEEFQKALEATQQYSNTNTLSERPKSDSGRRTSNTKEKTVTTRPSVIAAVEWEGRTLYPLIPVPLPSDVLNVAIDFMYSKYSADTNPEKRSLPLEKVEEGSPFRLIAASVILGI